jgi:hypothetical protein
MVRNFASVVIVMLMLSCGGGSDTAEQPNIPPVVITTPTPTPVPHCSDNTVLDFADYSSSAAGEQLVYVFLTNTCNNIRQARIHDGELYLADVDVEGFGKTSLNFRENSIYWAFLDEENSKNYAKYTNYTYVYGDDFMTKYNDHTTNTDIIYNHEDEYKLMMVNVLPENVELLLEEVTKNTANPYTPK